MPADPQPPLLLSGVASLLREIRSGSRVAVIGGLAVSARVEPRFTRDADVAVSVTGDVEAESVVGGLVHRGWRILAVIEQEEAGRLATVRLQAPRGGDVVCDLLFAGSGIEPEIVDAADNVEVAPGLLLPVAKVGHLIALKLLSVEERRYKDRQDLVSLSEAASPEEWERAAVAVRLMIERGYNRGRDLVAALGQLRDERTGPTAGPS